MLPLGSVDPGTVEPGMDEPGIVEPGVVVPGVVVPGVVVPILGVPVGLLRVDAPHAGMLASTKGKVYASLTPSRNTVRRRRSIWRGLSLLESCC